MQQYQRVHLPAHRGTASIGCCTASCQRAASAYCEGGTRRQA
ncbi:MULTISPECIES: hypothetical protein [Acinetobacter]|nr:hypothetical protein [Acinetobacter sp. 256-1]